ncbi:hypothetical protein [Brevibacillus laterosporus]|uniref:hypothetical protein n=1 Tax=Brevibacillus laterosporus TaxID=1465 RepID=UPI000839B1BD|nr:hypothetical protein [Brevibacillus laterosporus]
MSANDKEIKNFKKFITANVVWLCILFIAIIIFVITLALGDSSRAGENLSFASTMVSIVLAVIAIVITLIDVAGQRKNIIDLSETAIDLKQSIENIQNVVDEYQLQLNNVVEMSNKLNQMIDKNEKWRDQVLEKITDQKEEDITKDKVKEIISKVKIPVPKTRLSSDPNFVIQGFINELVEVGRKIIKNRVDVTETEIKLGIYKYCYEEKIMVSDEILEVVYQKIKNELGTQ